jgi:hypothetical protein
MSTDAGKGDIAMMVSGRGCWRCGSKSIRADGGVARCMQCGRDQNAAEKRRISLPASWR